MIVDVTSYLQPSSTGMSRLVAAEERIQLDHARGVGEQRPGGGHVDRQHDRLPHLHASPPVVRAAARP